MGAPKIGGFSGGALLDMLGVHVYKDVDLAAAADMFTITNAIQINRIYAKVTTAVVTTTTLKFRRKTDNVDMCAATTITSDVVNTLYLWSGDAGAILSGTLAAGDAPVVGVAHLAGGPASPVIFDPSGTIEAILDGAGTGIIRFHLWYTPLEAGSKVVAA